MLSEPDVPALRLERKAWTQRDFLEELTAEHFVVISEINEAQYGYAWMVDALDDDVDSCLDDLRSKLTPLGWVPNLEDDEPYILEISPIRVRSAVIQRSTQIFLWLLSFVFLTIIGAGWIGRVNSSIDSSSIEAFQIGGIQYALPIMSTIALASVVRRMVAKSHGVKVDHLLPISIPFPITGLSPIWPFGLIGILQLRRIDEIQFPNRISLALVSLVLPFTLIVSGIGFALIGLHLTPTNPLPIEEIPFVLDLNWFTELMGTLLIGESIFFRVQWASPMLLAGHGMTVVGFILLLPIPNFPGDHLYTAIRGAAKWGTETSEQAQLLLFTVVVALLVNFQGQFWIWIAIGSLAIWRRFQSDAIPIPLVINDTDAANTSMPSWVLPIGIVMLILSLPTYDVNYSIDDWNQDLDIEDWIDNYEILFENNSTLEYPLIPKGVLDSSGSIHVSPSGVIEGWIIEIKCPGEDDFSGLDCNYSNISQRTPGKLLIKLKPPSDSITGVVKLNLHLHSTTTGTTFEHQTTVKVGGSVRILNDGWFYQDENHCIEMVVGLESLPANITLNNPLWSIVGGETHSVNDPMNITIESPELVCVEPMEGAIQMADLSSDGGINGPTITYQSDDGSSYSLTARLMDVNRSAVALADGFEFDSSYPIDARSIGWHVNESSSCPEFVTTELSQNGNQTFDENNNNSQIIHVSENITNARLIIPNFGILTVCEQSFRSNYEMVSGPSILVNGKMLILDSNINDQSINLSNVGSESVSLIPVIHSSISLDSIWNISFPSEIGANSSYSFDSTRANVTGGFTAIWFESSSIGLEIHLAAMCYPSIECSLGD
ncbi:MAG: hypothetical protein CMB31_03200 [Euryarchaeota archaeon]|nr:hypothetical protein [Euryarchaeota archaeon]